MLLQLKEESGIEPQALARRPSLSKELVYPYQIWQSLSNSRAQSFSGVGRIPFSEFYLYASSLGYSGLELADFWSIVSLVDATFVSELTKIQEESAPKKK